MERNSNITAGFIQKPFAPTLLVLFSIREPGCFFLSHSRTVLRARRRGGDAAITKAVFRQSSRQWKWVSGQGGFSVLRLIVCDDICAVAAKHR